MLLRSGRAGSALPSSGEHKQMAALAFRPVRPMAIQKLLGDVRLHFVFFFLVVPQFVAGVVFAVRIHGGSERDGLPIRRPFRRCPRRSKDASGLRFATIHRQQIDLRIAARDERKAIVFPSGDHTGDESCPLCVSCIGAPPAVDTIQMLLALRFASMSGVATV